MSDTLLIQCRLGRGVRPGQTRPGQIRVGQDRVERGLWFWFLVCWGFAFGGGSAESCTRQDGPQPDQSKTTHRQAEGVKTRRSKQKIPRMTESGGWRGSR